MPQEKLAVLTNLKLFPLYCIFVNLVNTMLLTADLESPLLEHSTSRISMFLVMSSFSDRLVKSFI